MKIKHIWVNLSLFDGEGASGDSGGESTASAAGTQTGETAESGTEDAAPQTEEERRAAYDELIKGEYKDFYTQDTQKIINRRFKETKELKSQIDSYRPLMDILGQRYNASDVDSLVKAIENDNSYWEQAAYDANMSVDQYKMVQKLQRENNALREAQKQAEKEYVAKQTFNEWKAQEAELQQIYPSFNIDDEIQNPDFARLISSGVPVKHAFEVLHLNEITQAVELNTKKQTAKAVTDNIRAKGLRPAENGASSQNAFVSKVDVTKLTKQERAELARRAERGEKIEL